MPTSDWFRTAVHDLDSPEGEDRRHAIKDIGNRAKELRPEERCDVAHRLCELLAADDWEPVQMWSAWALGMLGEELAVDTLAAALCDDNRDVRCHAALALGRIGAPRAVADIEQLMRNDPDELTRKYAVSALGHFSWRPQHEDARQLLKSFADDEGIQPSVRAAASDELRTGTGSTSHRVTCVQVRMLDVPPADDPGAVVIPDGPLGHSVERKTVTTRVPQRDARAKEAYRSRVGTGCQICGEAGFSARGGGTFCEVHHIVPLADGGFDGPYNLLVVCPNCHRKLHHARSVKFTPDPWDRRPESVSINGEVFSIDWRDEPTEKRTT